MPGWSENIDSVVDLKVAEASVNLADKNITPWETGINSQCLCLVRVFFSSIPIRNGGMQWAMHEVESIAAPKVFPT